VGKEIQAMTRRRRPQREIAFSFESFLDIVANVVGIIIRLILVAWIGARSYKAVIPLPPPPAPPPALADSEPPPDPKDPRLEQIARRRKELSREEKEALARTQAEEAEIRAEEERLLREAQELARKREELEQVQEGLNAEAGKTGEKAKGILLSVEQLQKRSEQLLAELKKAESKPKQTKTLRYRCPVSAAVQTEEVTFECNAGRVTLFDRGALEGMAVQAARRRSDELRERWEITGETEAVGSFRLRYGVERQKGAMDGPGFGPPSSGSFSYAVTYWEAVPIESVRGESGDQALLPNSAFRRLVDELDSKQTVVTFWVYPDSFALYRRLRDYLHSRELIVAGRPLSEGMPIAASMRGTVSRGQ
jgi:hypothetical protein